LILRRKSSRAAPRSRVPGIGRQDNYEVKLSVIVADEQGNESEAYEYTVVCGLGNVQAGFPDLFDDNRNGWDVSGKFSIQNGQLQFRDSPSDAAYWVYCNGCIVTPDQTR